MIAHTPFFESLGTMRENEPAWKSVFAGLVVLRLIDSFRDYPERARAMEATTMASARTAASAIQEGDPTRELLRRIVSLIEEDQCLSPSTGRELLAYGRALDLEARWSLAADVFSTIVESFRGPENIELVIEASTALGAAARTTGDWKTSDRGYARAQHLADTTQNRALSLTVRVGVAGSHMVHGNLPAADEELEGVVAEAREHNLQQVEAIAIHAKAAVALSRQDYQRAVHLAYRSLELTVNRTARERILGDIAAGYAGLGMRDAARDGYSIVAITSPHQWVRWQATVNLMELAVLDGEEAQFDCYAEKLNSAALDPRLYAYSRYYQGLGIRRFGRGNADEMLRHARSYAAQHQLHQVVFEIDEALQPTPGNADVATARPAILSDENPAELKRIAEVIMHLREDAVAQAG